MSVQVALDLQAELSDRLRFETLIADISARFVNLPASEVDHAIEDAQRVICECLGVDHSTLWQLSQDDPDQMFLTHLRRDPSMPPPPGRMTGSEFFPWAQAMLRTNRLICMSDTEKAPPEAARDVETWRQFGVKSTLGIPLSVGGGPVIGVLSFEATRRTRDWPEPLVSRLQLLAQVFANALDRKLNEQKLAESESRMTLAAESANAGIWTLNPLTGEIWGTPKTFELFEIPPSERLDFAKFMSLVHPEDRTRVRRIIDAAMANGGGATAEFRVIGPDANVRWLISRGRRHVRSDGAAPVLMGVTIDITESKHLEQEHAELASRLLNAQEAESARIGRELHDDLGQSIALLGVQLHRAIELKKRGSPKILSLLEDLCKKTSLLGRKVSTLSHQLHSAELEFLGLAVAAKGLCREVSEEQELKVTCSTDPLPENLGSNIEICLFRVLQESLRNCVKHSQASKAEVKLQIDGQSIRLCVSDNGVGFDPRRRAGRLGLGLISMGERMRLVGGDFYVHSRPGQGTTIEARAPLPDSIA